MICDSQHDFEFSWLNSLLSWALSQQDKKSLKLSMDLWHLNNMKVILTRWTLNYVECIPVSGIDSFHISHNQAN